ncbi:MAG TPA: hypothetical protein VEY12_03705 [Thermoplasmata archaeon]|nr:hypothetical protein [Thermoplasmata archaeon]
MDVLFLSSVQGYQTDRVREIAERLRADRPDLTVRLQSPEESASLLAKYKLKFGPAIVINDRLEFVGIPRYRMLLERLEISKQRALAPPPAAAAPAPAPRPAPAGPAPSAKPGGPAG